MIAKDLREFPNVTWPGLLLVQWNHMRNLEEPMGVRITRKQMETLHQTWPFDGPAPPGDIDNLEWNSIHIEVS